MDDEEGRGDRELEWFGRNPRPGNIALRSSWHFEPKSELEAESRD